MDDIRPGFGQWAVTNSPEGSSKSARKRLYRLSSLAGVRFSKVCSFNSFALPYSPATRYFVRPGPSGELLPPLRVRRCFGSP